MNAKKLEAFSWLYTEAFVIVLALATQMPRLSLLALPLIAVSGFRLASR